MMTPFEAVMKGAMLDEDQAELALRSLVVGGYCLVPRKYVLKAYLACREVERETRNHPTLGSIPKLTDEWNEAAQVLHNAAYD